MTTPYIISTPQPPVGTVYPFIGGGTTIGGINTGDPNGWVLCDGVQRIVTDERYAALAPLLLTYVGGTQNANIITPPDLTSRMALGNTDTTPMVMTTGGTGGVMLKVSDIPSFDLETSSAHTHTFVQRDIGSSTNIRIMNRGAGGTSFAPDTSTAVSGITNAVYNNNNQTAASLLNNYSKVNYIMKY
jgi:microcystin-dependent protein